MVVNSLTSEITVEPPSLQTDKIPGGATPEAPVTSRDAHALSTQGLRSKQEILNVSNIVECKRTWDKQVKFHLSLHELTEKLCQLAEQKKLLTDLPEQEFHAIYDSVSFNHQDPELLKYQISFICLGCHSRDEYETYFLTNLMDLIALQLSDNREFYSQLLTRTLKPYTHKLIRTAIDCEFGSYSSPLPKFPDSLQENGQVVSYLDALKLLMQYYYIVNSTSFTTAIHRIHKYLGEDTTKPFFILSDTKLREQLPDTFKKNPKQYLADIESASEKPSQRTPIFVASKIRLGPMIPAESRGKITIIPLKNGSKLFCKRVSPLRVNYPEEEIKIAENAREVLQTINSNKNNIHLEAQDFVGMIYDGEGAFYLLSREVPHDTNLTEKKLSDSDRALVNLALEKIHGERPDDIGFARLKDCLYNSATSKPKVTFIDFETLPSYEDLFATQT